MKGVTAHGRRVRQRMYDFLVDFFMQNGYAPSVREITKAVGLKSTSSTYAHLLVLESDGKIEIKEKSPRAIRLVGYKFVKEETEESKDEGTDIMDGESNQ